MDMTTSTHRVKDIMARGDLALGMIMRLGRSADAVRIAAASGHACIYLDMQHGIHDIETISHMAHVAMAIGIEALVRVRGVDDPDIGRLLDNGVSGIVFPNISTADEARRAVEACRFPPLGNRSLAGRYPVFGFKPMSPEETTRRLDESTLVVCMIETPAAIGNLEEIARVKGVDILHLGTNDLLLSLGLPGAHDHPVLDEIRSRLVAATRQNGIFAGSGGNSSPQTLARAVAQGVQFATTQTDAALLFDAASRWITDIGDRP